MIVLFHIALALASIVGTTLAFISPSNFRLQISAGLVALTLLSGTYLVWHMHAALFGSCVSGLVYLSSVSAGLFVSRRKLAHVQAK